MNKYIKKNVLAWSCGISIMTSLISVYMSKMLISEKPHIQNWGLVGTVGLLLGIMVLLYFLCAEIRTSYGKKQTKLPFFSFAMCGLLFLIFAVGISFIGGLLAQTVYALLKDIITFSQIKVVIEILSSIMSILIFPILINLILSIILCEGSFLKSLASGFVLREKRYVKYLGVFLGLMLVGYGCEWVLAHVHNYFLASILYLLICIIVGTISVPLIIAIYDPYE